MELYGTTGSAACRAVLMTAEAVNQIIKLREIDIRNKDHLPEKFTIFNPQRTIPVLVDDGFQCIIRDSVSAMIYLADQYGRGDLYPKDPRRRALVNQLLFFDVGTLYQRLADYYGTQVKENLPADTRKWELMEEAMQFLDIYLKNGLFALGEQMTIADLSLLSTVSNYEAINFDLGKYKFVSKWYHNIKDSAPGANINKEGCNRFKKFLQMHKIIQ